jgi:hypothetical protein
LAETEKEWAQVVADYARLCGWARFHPFLSIHSPSGWPDETFCRPPRLVVAELKSEKGKLTAAQRRWLDLLGACPPLEVYVWRPSDWPQVQAVLR